MAISGDRHFMRMAVRLGRKGLGRTAPNPAVGAVVVREGRVVGRGYHKKAGGPHAEVHALEDAGEKARGATIYVTLEPCNHTGRTPPCTRAILEAGISRCVFGVNDPNPSVEGGGGDFLQRRGVQVDSGVLYHECALLTAPFAKHVKTGLPWVRSKIACSLDGRTATRTGHSQWITNEKARAYGHRLRSSSDAILAGRGTVEADNPRLTCRMAGGGSRDPVRVILDSHLALSSRYQVFSLESQAPTWIFCAEGLFDHERRQELVDMGTGVFPVRPDREGRVDVRSVLGFLGERGIQSVLVEGGATVHGAFWDLGLVDEAYFFYAPVVIGGLEAAPAIGGLGSATVDEAACLEYVEIRSLAGNWLVHGTVRAHEELYGVYRDH